MDEKETEEKRLIRDEHLKRKDYLEAEYKIKLNPSSNSLAKKVEEPEIDENINKISESRVRYETLRNKRKPPEFFEKNNSNVNLGLAEILAMRKRIKD